VRTGRGAQGQVVCLEVEFWFVIRQRSKP
jgi:hypothetical protein